MSLEDQYDAWVRSVTGARRYGPSNKEESDAAKDSLDAMQAQLDALTAAQKRQKSAVSALDAVQRASAATADSVRRMSNELTETQPLTSPALRTGCAVRSLGRMPLWGRSSRPSAVLSSWERPTIPTPAAQCCSAVHEVRGATIR